MEQSRKFGFAGPLWHVHPKRGDFSSIEDLPSAPDAAFVGVNRAASIEIVRELSAMGAGGAVCFASGFREAQGELEDGPGLEAALLDAAGPMRLLGPNCYGFLNALDGVALWPDQHGLVAVERGVAIVMQSSNVAINLTMQRRGLPIAYMVTAGNQAQADLAEIGMALLADARVTALGLHIEGIADLAAFEALAAAALRSGKRIVALKVGRSEQARTAALSHTASLAGSDAGGRALLRRLGIAQTDSFAAMLECLKVLHVTGPLPSNRLVSLSCSGGEATLMADEVARSSLELPALNAHQRQGLRQALGPKVTLANPLDYHTYIWGDLPAVTRCFVAAMAADLALGCVVIDFPRSDRCDPKAWLFVVDAVEAAMRETGKPIALLSLLAENMPEAIAEDCIARGILPLAGLGEAVDGLHLAAELGRCCEMPLPIWLPQIGKGGVERSEAEAKTALAAYGLQVPRAGTASSAAAAGDLADRIGFPVVLKGEGIAHKTEAGAVVLGLADRASVVEAAQAMPTQRFLVERQIVGVVAELSIGVVVDPAHGYVLTLSAGGVLVELLQDSVSLVLPVTATAVGAALDKLKIAPLLAGYRGKPVADREAIVQAVLAVQALVAARRGHLIEVEVNPLLCLESGAVAVDALLRETEDER